MSRPHSWVGPATRDPGTVTGPTRPTALHEAYGRQLTEMLVKVLDVSYVTAVAQEATAPVTALHRRSTRTRPRAAS